MTMTRRLARLAAIALIFGQLAACAAREPLPQPRRVADPASVPGAVVTESLEIAAVAYEHTGQGLNYNAAGLDPVLLIVKNKAQDSPRILLSEVRGSSAGGDFLAYSVDEAQQLVFASEASSYSTAQAARPGALGALVGGALGALAGTVAGGDSIWKGAAIGAGVGAAAGAGVGMAQNSETDLKTAIRKEMVNYAWTDEAIAPTFTKIGYVYLPKQDMEELILTVRTDNSIKAYRVPVLKKVAEQK